MADLFSVTQKSNLKKKMKSAKTLDCLPSEISPKKFGQSPTRDRKEVNQSMAIAKINFLAIPEEVSSPGTSNSVSATQIQIWLGPNTDTEAET